MKQAVKNARKAVLVVLDLSYQSAREQLAGIYRFQQTHEDWDIRLIPSNDPRFQTAILQSLSENVNGAVVKIGSALDVTPILQSNHIPVVIIERPPRAQLIALKDSNRPFAVIGIDNSKVGAMAANYLSHLGNFANYLFIHDPNKNEWSRLRGLAFLRTLRRRGRSGRSLSLPQLERALPTLQTPLAIFAAFDLLSTSVLKICKNANMSIPNDAVILSVDNDSVLCENTNPSLSSIRLAHEDLGYSAAKALHALMSSKRIPTSEELPPLDVVVRNSTTNLPPARMLVDRAMRIIENHGPTGIRVTDIARQLGVSVSLLKLRFQQTRNCSLRDTLITTRLDEVTRLLKTSDYPVSQIAKMCGFSSSVVLNHLFKRKFGTSPGRWRRRCGGTLGT